ncbi:MAG: RNA-directed DNA polymerase [Maribacter sp.]|nr:RNA-directed DNA polymerase [Maribacter sp.]
MANHQKVKDFYLWDYEGTLFPMETCRLLVENNSDTLSNYISKIASPKEKDFSFLSQETVYASKTQHHLRRTMKLDPVAEYYLYDMAYKNRKIFRKGNNPTRENFGYRFADGNPIPIHKSYKEFSARAEELKKKYKYIIKFDISAYFNSIYHHDITNWFSSQKTTQADVGLFGQYMREINTGFSIDFLPHGLYPSKMLGSHFLSFMDHSELVKSEHMIRFMDDYMLFSNSKDTLIKDFQTIQKCLGQKSLNLNADKTVLFSEKTFSIGDEIDDIKGKIMEKVHIGSGSGMDYEEYEEAVRDLSTEEIEYLVNLLDEDEATDLEASLILDCIHEHTTNFAEYLPEFIYRFPHLSKKIYHKCEDVTELEELSEKFVELLSGLQSLNEYQLFWIAKISEKFLLQSNSAGQLLALLYEHKDATNISKSKVLEIPEQRFGMPEWREVHLKNGSSGWLSWSSAVGMRNDTKQSRNYLMGYFSKVSTINALIGEYVVGQ